MISRFLPDFSMISRFWIGFQDFGLDFKILDWISRFLDWISRFWIDFNEISVVADPVREA